MPDATEMLIEDHRKVESLFERYESSKDPRIADEICTELAVHAAIEEKVLYPVTESELEDGRAMRSHAEEEHGEVKRLIFEVQEAGEGSSEAEALMTRMKAAVVEHVQEEEQEIFPALREALDEERLEALGSSLAKAKTGIAREAKSAGPLFEVSRDKLYELAQHRGIKGRSDMTKEELLHALRAS